MSREPPRRGQRLVRLDALFAAQRQAEGRDRHRHAAPARGRSRRPRARGRAAGSVVSFPAIAEEDEAHAVETPLGPRGRSAARPAKRSTRRASRSRRSSRIRATIGEMNFAAQYQQRPAPAGGGMVKAAWFRRYPAGRAARPSTASCRAGTPPTSQASLPTIPSAPPGASRARASISSTSCARSSPTRSSSAR